MTFFNASIMGGDYQWDLAGQILNYLGFSGFEEENLDFIKKGLEENIDQILKMFRGDILEHIGFQVLGYIILETGAKVRADIIEKIIQSTLWDVNKNDGWIPNFYNIRNYYLSDLRKKIKSYHKKTKLIDLKIYDDNDYNQSIIGLDNLIDFKAKNKIIRNIILDNSNLRDIPNEIENFPLLKVLSLDFNHLTKINPIIISCKGLRKIFLNNNKIRFIPNFFKEFKILEEIHLESNRIAQIPDFLQDIRCLKLINLKANALIRKRVLINNYFNKPIIIIN
jgi:hypothetical protein